MEVIDVVRKLLGPIEAVGDTGVDERHLKNLEATIAVVDGLLYDINIAARDADRAEYSMRSIGQRAKSFLAEVVLEYTSIAE